MSLAKDGPPLSAASQPPQGGAGTEDNRTLWDITKSVLEQADPEATIPVKVSSVLADAALIAALRARVAEAERERNKWRNWHPDDEVLKALQEQAKNRDGSYTNGLAACGAYIGGLEARIRDLATVDENSTLALKALQSCKELYEERDETYGMHNGVRIDNPIYLSIVAALSSPVPSATPEAEALGAELIQWAANKPQCYEYSFVCSFCGCELPDEAENHKSDCLHLRAWTLLMKATLTAPANTTGAEREGRG